MKSEGKKYVWEYTTLLHLIKPIKVTLTLLFEGEIFGEMTTLVIAAQQRQCIRIGDL